MARAIMHLPLSLIIDVLAHIEPLLMNRLALGKLQVHQIYTLLGYTMGWETDTLIKEPVA